jgi:hypothetical protein
LVRDVFVFTNGAWLKEGMAETRATLHFHRRALLFQLGLDRRGLVLRNAGLHRLRRAVDEILRFLEAQAGDLADHLDDLDLLAAGVLQQDVELGLLFRGRSRRRAATTRGRSAHRGRGDRHVELRFEGIDQLGELEDGLVADRFEDLVVRHGRRHLVVLPM